jgi:cupin fold WbuC family metalloprotein
MTVAGIRLIDQALLDTLAAEAAASPRRRKNRNFHPGDDFVAHRLLNALEPDSYVMPHRHLAIDKDETLIALRGRFGFLAFDDSGKVRQRLLVEAGGPLQGVDIAHGTWHTVFALESGSIFFEAKAGPFVPLAADERATWAPAESDAAAAALRLAEWRQLFASA